MPQNLHRSVRETYRKAVATNPHNAFDLAAELLSACAPWLAPPAARKMVAEMLCWEPSLSISFVEELPR